MLFLALYRLLKKMTKSEGSLHPNNNNIYIWGGRTLSSIIGGLGAPRLSYCGFAWMYLEYASGLACPSTFTISALWVLLHFGWSIPLVKWFHSGWLDPVSLRGIRTYHFLFTPTFPCFPILLTPQRYYYLGVSLSRQHSRRECVWNRLASRLWEDVN